MGTSSSEHISVELAAKIAQLLEARLVEMDRFSREESFNQLEKIYSRVGDVSMQVTQLTGNVRALSATVDVHSTRLGAVEMRLHGLETQVAAAAAETTEHRKHCEKLFMQQSTDTSEVSDRVDRHSQRLSQLDGHAVTGVHEIAALRRAEEDRERLLVRRREWRWRILTAAISLLAVLISAIALYARERSVSADVVPLRSAAPSRTLDAAAPPLVVIPLPATSK